MLIPELKTVVVVVTSFAVSMDTTTVPTTVV